MKWTKEKKMPGWAVALGGMNHQGDQSNRPPVPSPCHSGVWLGCGSPGRWDAAVQSRSCFAGSYWNCDFLVLISGIYKFSQVKNEHMNFFPFKNILMQFRYKTTQFRSFLTLLQDTSVRKHVFPFISEKHTGDFSLGLSHPTTVGGTTHCFRI